MTFSFTDRIFAFPLTIGTFITRIPINQNLSYSLFNKLDIENRKERSYTIKKVRDANIIYNNSLIPVIEYSDQITFSQIKNNSTFNLNFYISNLLNFTEHGLAFGYKIEKEDSSITHLLKKHNYIDTIAYTFVPSNDYFGNILFGRVDLRKLFQSNTSNDIGTCSVDKSRSSWSCLVESVTFDKSSNQTIFLNSYASFHSEIRFSLFPLIFFKFLKSNVLKKSFENNDCRLLNEEGLEGSFVVCYSGAFYFKPFKIIFRLNGVNIGMNVSELFIRTGRYNFRSNFLISNYSKNDFVFGAEFLAKFITTFDYEKSSISFLQTKSTIVKSNLEPDKNRKMLFLILLEIGLISCYLPLIIFFKFYFLFL